MDPLDNSTTAQGDHQIPTDAQSSSSSAQPDNPLTGTVPSSNASPDIFVRLSDDQRLKFMNHFVGRVAQFSAELSPFCKQEILLASNTAYIHGAAMFVFGPAEEMSGGTSVASTSGGASVASSSGGASVASTSGGASVASTSGRVVALTNGVSQSMSLFSYCMQIAVQSFFRWCLSWDAPLLGDSSPEVATALLRAAAEHQNPAGWIRDLIDVFGHIPVLWGLPGFPDPSQAGPPVSLGGGGPGTGKATKGKAVDQVHFRATASQPNLGLTSGSDIRLPGHLLRPHQWQPYSPPPAPGVQRPGTPSVAPPVSGAPSAPPTLRPALSVPPFALQPNLGTPAASPPTARPAFDVPPFPLGAPPPTLRPTSGVPPFALPNTPAAQLPVFGVPVTRLPIFGIPTAPVAQPPVFGVPAAPPPVLSAPAAWPQAPVLGGPAAPAACPPVLGARTGNDGGRKGKEVDRSHMQPHLGPASTLPETRGPQQQQPRPFPPNTIPLTVPPPVLPQLWPSAQTSTSTTGRLLDLSAFDFTDFTQQLGIVGEDSIPGIDSIHDAVAKVKEIWNQSNTSLVLIGSTQSLPAEITPRQIHLQANWYALICKYKQIMEAQINELEIAIREMRQWHTLFLELQNQSAADRIPIPLICQAQANCMFHCMNLLTLVIIHKKRHIRQY